MKKSIMDVGLLVAVVAMLANNALAGSGGIVVPDGGSTAILVAVSVFGLNLFRKLFR